MTREGPPGVQVKDSDAGRGLQNSLDISSILICKHPSIPAQELRFVN